MLPRCAAGELHVRPHTCHSSDAACTSCSSRHVQTARCGQSRTSGTYSTDSLGMGLSCSTVRFQALDGAVGSPHPWGRGLSAKSGIYVRSGSLGELGTYAASHSLLSPDLHPTFWPKDAQAPAKPRAGRLWVCCPGSLHLGHGPPQDASRVLSSSPSLPTWTALRCPGLLRSPRRVLPSSTGTACPTPGPVSLKLRQAHSWAPAAVLPGISIWNMRKGHLAGL